MEDIKEQDLATGPGLWYLGEAGRHLGIARLAVGRVPREKPMSKILKKLQLAPKIFEFVVEAPRIAKKAQPGHFVVVMADERGERIPLTIADFDRAAGTDHPGADGRRRQLDEAVAARSRATRSTP